MQKNKLSDKIYQLIADDGKILVNGESYGTKITSHIDNIPNWKEVDESQKPVVCDIDYNEEVNKKIRERYSISEEFAILRQRDAKPEEFKRYNEYCEECKNEVKTKMANYAPAE